MDSGTQHSRVSSRPNVPFARLILWGRTFVAEMTVARTGGFHGPILPSQVGASRALERADAAVGR
jgi:hypothetical protein